MSPLNPKQDAEFQALARQLVNLKRKPVSRNIRKIFDPDSHLFDQDVEAEYDEEVFLRDFGALSPDLIWPTFDFWPQDLGSGIADIVPVVGGVAPTFTRATTATTVDRNGLIVSVASGSPRSYYDPTSLTYLGYLAEGARTNLCLQSEDLATTWTNGNTTETVNAVASPDGATTADKLVETAAVGQHYIDQTFVKAGSAVQYSFSVFLKAAERDMIQVLVGNTALTGYSVCATVNLAAGTVGSASAAGSFVAGTTRLTAYPNGWYRFEMNGLTSDTDVGLRVRVYLGDGASFSYAGDITKGAYVWGAQLEAATFASSYIPTTTVAVARNADVLTLPPAGWYSATAGTFFVDAAPLSDSVALTQTAASVYTNTSNYIAVEKFNANVSGNIVDGGVTQAAMAATATTNRTLFKAAMAYASNDGAASVNGGTVGTDAAMSIPATTTAGIGHTAAANHFFGTIRRGTYFNQRLPNYLLQRITANGFDRSVAP